MNLYFVFWKQVNLPVWGIVRKLPHGASQWTNGYVSPICNPYFVTLFLQSPPLVTLLPNLELWFGEYQQNPMEVDECDDLWAEMDFFETSFVIYYS